MYGLLLQAALEFISSKFSQETAQHVLAEAAGGGALDVKVGLGRAGFSIHQLYSDKVLIRLAQCTADACNLRLDQVMEQFGHFFVRYTHQAGYENLLRVLGRSLSDFVLGLDNLHEYFRGTYPKLKAPSFSVVDEDANGMTICYRSIRSNLQGYVAGQVSEVARLYYGITVTVSAQPAQIDARGKYAVLMRLDFDNNSFLERRMVRIQMPLPQARYSPEPTPDEHTIAPNTMATSRSTGSGTISLSVRQQRTNPEAIFEKISFYMILNRELEIVSSGRGVTFAMPGVMGRDFNEVFEIIRPAIPCNWANILDFANNVFEVHSLQPIQIHHDDLVADARNDQFQANAFHDGVVSDRLERFTHLRLRGQMIHFEEWDCLIFLAMPIIDTLKELNMLGLKIHDLSMMDSSRELITLRHHRDLGKDPLMMQEAKIGNRLDSLNDEATLYRHRRVALLEEAIPRFILRSADKLTKSHYATKAASVTCSLNFSKSITTASVVKEIIMTLNSVFRKFDAVAAKYNLCKVMSIAYGYQVMVGLPFHANLPANLAILIAEEMIEAAEVSNDAGGQVLSQAKLDGHSSTRKSKKSVIGDIQVAVDIGPVIGTVVGVTIPRYLACGRPVTITQRIVHVAIPNTVTITEMVVSELKKNEFAINYDYKPLATIQVPLLTGSENIELFTVCSVGRKMKREEQAMAKASRRRGPRGALSGSVVSFSSSTVTSTALPPEVTGIAKDFEPKIPRLMKLAATSGEAVPMNQLMNTEDRAMSQMSSTPSRITSNSRCSTQLTVRNNDQNHAQPEISTPTTEATSEYLSMKPNIHTDSQDNEDIHIKVPGTVPSRAVCSYNKGCRVS